MPHGPAIERLHDGDEVLAGRRQRVLDPAGERRELTPVDEAVPGEALQRAGEHAARHAGQPLEQAVVAEGRLAEREQDGDGPLAGQQLADVGREAQRSTARSPTAWSRNVVRRSRRCGPGWAWRAPSCSTTRRPKGFIDGAPMKPA